MSTTSPPMLEDRLRAVGYVAATLWAAYFLIRPPVVYLDGLALGLLIIWMGTIIIGGLLALAGSVLAIDIKLEMPGLLLQAVGTLVYFGTQLFLFLVSLEPQPGVAPAAPGRDSLALFVLWHLTLLLPRTVSLIIEAREAKKKKRQALIRAILQRRVAGEQVDALVRRRHRA